LPKLNSGNGITPTQDQVIPEGQVFLYSPHPKSFDSRYQEVGLVQVSDLEGTAIAIA
jgi:type IV secretory pathway protease TraF